jgi:hypothetical protein
MNINQTLAAVALTILTFGGALAAYGLRYVPMGGEGYGNAVLVWDRWEQEVCQIYYIEQNRYCAKIRPK